MKFLWLVVGALFVSWILTLYFRHYALSRNIMDLPNERSSHVVPTPRGGGVAIVITVLSFFPILFLFDLISYSDFKGILGAGLLVAIVGFADDRGHIAARWRLLAHFTAAAWVLLNVHYIPTFFIFGSSFENHWLGSFFSLLYLVWMLNLYNFMDGIDGLASAEAVSVCLCMSIIYILSGNGNLIWVPLILAFAVLGFMYWNFPFARIFMGDAGSGFLGITLGALSIQIGVHGSELVYSWIIMLGVFVADATLTLFRRTLRGEKIYQAHRSHGYQHAAILYKQHHYVTGCVAAINVFFLFPIAALVGCGGISPEWGVLLAYCPLFALAWKYDAGLPNRNV